MAKTIYYYRVNSKGLPLINSNNKIVGKFPKGRVVIYDPMFKICCDENITMSTFSNKKQRYFIKLDERNHPISNSLIMRSSKPKGNWQEVGPKCCIIPPDIIPLILRYTSIDLENSITIIVEEGENVIITTVEEFVQYLISLDYDASIHSNGDILIKFTEESLEEELVLDILDGEETRTLILTLHNTPSPWGD